MEREQIVKDYFQSWMNKDIKVLRTAFDSKAVYSECYGPEYHGIDMLERWFTDWNKRGSVLSWDIKQFIHQDNRIAAEWYFKCEYDGEIGEFDGVSLIEFNMENRIISLKEFQSKLPHYYPYQ